MTVRETATAARQIQYIVVNRAGELYRGEDRRRAVGVYRSAIVSDTTAFLRKTETINVTIISEMNDE